MWVQTEVPSAVLIERSDVDDLLGGSDGPDPKIAPAAQYRWIDEGRSAALTIHQWSREPNSTHLSIQFIVMRSTC